MKVTIRESGGFAPGLRKQPKTIESSELSEEKAAELGRLVEAARSSETEEPARPGRSRDAVNYTITVEDEGDAVELKRSDADLPQPVADLIEWIDQNRKDG